jgi:SnoaL-like domain
MRETERVVAVSSATIADERAILRVLYAYCHAIDYGEESKWVGLFTSDGVFHVELPRGLPPIHCAGQKELAAFISAHPRAPAALHKHLLLNPLIDLQGDKARAASYFQLLLDIDGTPETYCFGRYLDSFVRSEGGLWQFRERVAQVQSMRASGFPRNT